MENGSIKQSIKKREPEFVVTIIILDESSRIRQTGVASRHPIVIG